MNTPSAVTPVCWFHHHIDILSVMFHIYSIYVPYMIHIYSNIIKIWNIYGTLLDHEFIIKGFSV